MALAVMFLATVLLGALVTGAAFVQFNNGRLTAALAQAGEPWTAVRRDPILQAVGNRTSVGLDVALRIAERPPGAGTSASSDQRTFLLDLTLTGNAEDPLVRLARGGRFATSGGLLLDAVSGNPSFTNGSFAFDPPTVRVSDGTATIHVTGTADMTAVDTTTITLPSGEVCPRSREVSVDVTDYVIVGVRNGGGLPEGCSTGTWTSQGDTAATLNGGGDATIDLRTKPRDSSPPQFGASLIPHDARLQGLLSAVGYGALAVVPLSAVWIYLKRPGSTTAARRVGAVAGALVALSLITTLGDAIDWLYSLGNALAHRIGVAWWSVPTEFIEAVAIVGLAYVWRRAAIQSVRSPGTKGRPAGRDVLVLVVASLAVLAFGIAVEWPESLGVASVGPTASGGGWLDAWPGVVVTGAGVGIAAALAGMAMRHRSAADAGATFPVVAIVSAVIAVGVYSVVLALGYLNASVTYDSISDADVLPKWWRWLASTSGLLMLIAVCVAPVVAVVAASWTYQGVTRRTGWAIVRCVLGALVLALLAVAFVVFVVKPMSDPAKLVTTGWVSESPSWSEWLSDSPGASLGVLAPTLTIGVIAALGLVRLLGGGARTAWSVAAAVPLSMLVAALAPLISVGGIVGMMASALPSLVAGVLLWLTLDVLVRHAVSAAPPATWQRVRPLLRRWRGLRIPIALALSVPLAVYTSTSSGPILDWFSFRVLASSVAACSPLIILMLLLVVLRQLGSPLPGHVVTRGSAAQIRAVALLAAVTALLTPTATVANLPVAFVLGWIMFQFWLLPRPSARGPGEEPRPVFGWKERRRSRAILEAMAARTAAARERAALERSLRKNLADGTPSAEVQEQRLARLAALSAAGRGLNRRIAGAMSTFGGDTPWATARRLALVGFLAGLPWVLFDVTSLISTLSSGGAFRLVDAAAAVVVLLRFSFAGVVVGAAYPWVRGDTGLAKGMALFLALAVPALCLTLLPDPGAPGAASAALFQLAQLLAFCLVFGLTADLLTLHKAELGWRQLRDVHNMTALTASISSVALAVVTATVTALGTGAAGMVVEHLLPQAPASGSSSAGK